MENETCCLRTQVGANSKAKVVKSQFRFLSPTMIGMSSASSASSAVDSEPLSRKKTAEDAEDAEDCLLATR